MELRQKWSDDNNSSCSEQSNRIEETNILTQHRHYMKYEHVTQSRKETKLEIVHQHTDKNTPQTTFTRGNIKKKFSKFLTKEAKI